MGSVESSDSTSLTHDRKFADVDADARPMQFLKVAEAAAIRSDRVSVEKSGGNFFGNFYSVSILGTKIGF